MSEETAELRRVEALVKDKDERLESMEKSSVSSFKNLNSFKLCSITSIYFFRLRIWNTLLH